MNTSVHENAAILGRLGGEARAKAIRRAKRTGVSVGSLGGRKPLEENLQHLEDILSAIDAARSPEDRVYLLNAFIRLAPGSLYQTRWKTRWGRKLTEAQRRPLRGWGPEQRDRAVVRAHEVLGK